MHDLLVRGIIPWQIVVMAAWQPPKLSGVVRIHYLQLLERGVTMNSEENVMQQAKKQAEPKDPEKSPEPEPLPENFIKDENGWGLCPVCRKKILKLTSTTKLVNFPAYCKACKSEYVVSWWNVENKDIAYTRYVNNKHFIDRRNIRSKGMQWTGVGTFQHTRTSATERVAMQL